MPVNTHSNPLPPFAAIDFETANAKRDSAISVAIVRMERGLMTERMSTLIRPCPPGLGDDFSPKGYPPPDYFNAYNSAVHGLERSNVLDAPTFAQVWPRVRRLLRGCQFLVAHNAPFDRSVFAHCAENAGLPVPAQPWICTVKLCKAMLPLASHRLNLVAAHFDIPLVHHDALSDATACALIAQRLHSLFPQSVTEAVALASSGTKRGRVRHPIQR